MILPPAKRPKLKPRPGDRVRFTRTFLSATSQQSTAVWSVVECRCELCAKGKHVAVNEPAPADPFGNGTIAWGTPWRHIHVSNIETVEVDAAPLTPRVTKEFPR